MRDNFVHRMLVLVAGYRYRHAQVAQVLQQFGHTVVRLGVVGAVLVIVFHEVGQYAVHALVVTGILGQHTRHQTPHAVAHKVGVTRHRVGGVAAQFKGVIGRLAQVLDGVEQRAVQVKYHQFLHVVISFDLDCKGNIKF